jgi:CheY-like chemotaxis protein
MAHVLIVDDEAGIRSFLHEAVELFGHRATSASDGLEAIARLNADLPDLMITDLTMPRLGGMELLVHVRSRHPQLPHLKCACSGWSEPPHSGHSGNTPNRTHRSGWAGVGRGWVSVVSMWQV